MIQEYYNLTKPGIIYGNAVTAVAGFFLASKGNVDIFLLIAMLVGLAGVIGGSCVLNNYYDRDIDAHMERTKNRALVTGRISGKTAIFFGLILTIVGAMILGFHANLLSVAVALFGFFAYLGLYTPLKRKTIHATLVGALAGAVPPVVGYVAVSNSIDQLAVLLFLILVTWQMPHFYAIALFRLEEYKAAKIPVWPIVKGVASTKRHMLVYIILFSLITLSLTPLRYTGYAYFLVLLILDALWIFLAISGLRDDDEKKWGRKMFFFSLIILLSFSVMISTDFFVNGFFSGL